MIMTEYKKGWKQLACLKTQHFFFFFFFLKSRGPCSVSPWIKESVGWKKLKTPGLNCPDSLDCCCSVKPGGVWLYVRRCWLRSVSSPSRHKRRSSAFHTPPPGDGHVTQLLHTRCLIVLFVYLAALFHFLCCWRWENTQQYSRNSALSPSLSLLSSPLSIPPSSSFPLTRYSVLIRFSPHQSVLWERICKVIHRATTMPVGSHVFPDHT